MSGTAQASRPAAADHSSMLLRAAAVSSRLPRLLARDRQQRGGERKACGAAHPPQTWT